MLQETLAIPAVEATDLETRLTKLETPVIERLADRVLQVNSLDEFLGDL